MKKYLRTFLLILSVMIFYLLCGEPFRQYLKLSPVTEVRPVAVFPFLFGLLFGLPGTLACALGNILADIRNHMGPELFIPGFVIQMLYSYPFVILWKYLRRNDDNIFRLNRLEKVIQFIGIVIISAAVSSLSIYVFLHFLFKTPVLCLGLVNTFCNNLIFYIILGIPFMLVSSIVKQKRNNNSRLFKFSINEKMIVSFLALSSLISVIASFLSWFVLSEKYQDDPMTLWSLVYYVCISFLMLTLLPSLIVLFYIEKRIATPLERMSHLNKNFGNEKNLQLELAKINLLSEKYTSFTSEIGDLARSLQNLSSTLETYIEDATMYAAAEEKTRTQLDIATRIQLGSLPKPFDVPGLKLSAITEPALEVGGDFYDFFMLDDKNIALIIADVSGKGIPAALFMMISRIMIKYNLKYTLSPAEALEKANNDICQHNPAEMFVTVFCGVLNLETKTLTYANAGHEKPAVCKKNGNFELINSKANFVVGGMSGIPYKNYTYQLESGDTIFTYTDGIPEAMSPSNEEFGNERMLAALDNVKDKDLSEICDYMKCKVQEFNDTAPQFDDITMLAVRID